MLRFTLGAAEAGFFPGILLYLGYWYPPSRRSQIMAIFAAGAPISFIFGNPLSAWIIHAFEGVGGLWGWQWMFLLEALPSIGLGILAWQILPNRPIDAAWLSEREREAVVSEVATASAGPRQHSTSIGELLLDRRTWILCVAGFGAYTLSNAVSFWSPIIISSAGVSNIVDTGLLAALPPMLGVMAMFINGWHADRRHERIWHSAGCTLIAATALAALGFFQANAILVVALLSVVTVGHYAGSSAMWAIPGLYYAPREQARGIAIVTTVGSLAAMLAPAIMGTIKIWTGNLLLGLLVSAVFVATGAVVLVLGLPARLLHGVSRATGTPATIERADPST
jgi:MFS family permease